MDVYNPIAGQHSRKTQVWEKMVLMVQLAVTKTNPWEHGLDLAHTVCVSINNNINFSGTGT
jgi:hypothetical protein